MTTINDITDLLRILNEQPEWADQVRAVLLGQRFLELPDRVDSLERAIEDLARVVREFAEATDRRLSRLEEDVSGLKSDMAEVKADVSGLKSDMVEVKAGIARIEEKMDQHDRTFSTLGGHVDRLRGHDYEGVAAEPARRKLRDALNMSGLSVFSQSCKPNTARMDELARNARIAGAISHDDQADLTLADVTYEGTKDGEQVFVLAEISITVELDDVERAAHRASLLHQATGVPTLAAVIGAGIEADAAREADSNSVAYAQVPEE